MGRSFLNLNREQIHSARSVSKQKQPSLWGKDEVKMMKDESSRDRGRRPAVRVLPQGRRGAEMDLEVTDQNKKPPPFSGRRVSLES